MLSAETLASLTTAKQAVETWKEAKLAEISAAADFLKTVKFPTTAETTVDEAVEDALLLVDDLLGGT